MVPAVKHNFLSLSLITLEEIKAIWRRADDKDPYENLGAICSANYNWEDPLYVKMIHRFNNCNRRIAQFYHQVDPNNQRRLLTVREWDTHQRLAKAGDMMTFFAWLSNMLSIIDIIKLEGLTYQNGVNYRDPDVSIYVSLWDRNPIVFFYTVLSVQQQRGLIDKYNDVEVKAYNQMCLNRDRRDRHSGEDGGENDDNSEETNVQVLIFSMGNTDTPTDGSEEKLAETDTSKKSTQEGEDPLGI